MLIITLLGTGNYQKTTYEWKENDKTCAYTTEFFPEAIAHFFQPDKIMALVTSQAKAHANFKNFCDRLPGLIEAIDIPEGKSEQDLWAIFDKCAAAIDEKETIILDITHAFRSLPLYVFTVAAYLRRTKGVKIKHIVYGAYEARDERNHSPTLDLTPLLDLMDWLSGAEALLTRSDTRSLADSLDNTQQRIRKSVNTGELPSRLQSVAKQMRDFYQALAMSCPVEAMQCAERLATNLDKAAHEIEQWTKPFAVILKQVRSEIGRLAYRQSNQLDGDNIRKQFELIIYCLEKDLIVQAVTLAREWVISWVILQRGGDNSWLDKKYRAEIETALGIAAAQKRGQTTAEEVPEWFSAMPYAETIALLWDQLVNLRNEIAHCGMRPNRQPASTIVNNARQVLNGLKILLEEVPDNIAIGGRIKIHLDTLYDQTARMDDLPVYLEKAKQLAGEGNEILLTGQAPVWLYLAVAHALHGKARKLVYQSPATGEVTVFDHSC